MKKRIISIVLSIVMLVGLLPTTALAMASDSVYIDGVYMGDGNTPTYYKNSDTDATTGSESDYNAKLWKNGGVLTLTLNGLNLTSTSQYGIRANADLTIVLEGENTVKAADTVGNESYGVFTQNALTISGSGTLNVTGGTSEESNSYGIYANGGFTMTGGTVNAAGGGAYGNSYGIEVSGTSDTAAMNVSGGTINATGGSSRRASYGIKSYNYGDGQGLSVTGGTVTATGGNPTYSGGSYGVNATVTVSSGELTATGGTAVDEEASYGILGNATVTGGTVTASGQTQAFSAEPTITSVCTVNAGEDEEHISSVDKNADLTTYKYVKVVSEPPHSHCVCGDDKCRGDGHDPSQVWIATNELPNSSGHYYLTADVEIASTWTPANGTFLCLNGHKIKMTGNGDVIVAKNYFTLTDCRTPQGEITHSSEATGDGVKVTYNGTFNMYGGNITGNNSSGNAGGVKVSYGTFNMYGGSITNNKAPSDFNGGGVYIDSSTNSSNSFNMYGGTISGNIATSGGGVYVRDKAAFNMYGGDIIDNKATYGGGVYMLDTTSAFTMTDGSISSNTAANNGGGVYVYKGTFTVSGSPVITGNTVSDKANNVYLPSGKAIAVNQVLEAGTNIGVKMDEPGVFAKPDGTNVKSLAGYVNFFTSDNANYEPAVDDVDDTELSLVATHEHGNWSYSYSDGTLTATCGNSCPTGYSVTAEVNIGTVEFSLSYECPVTVTPSSEWTAAGAGTVTVTDNKNAVPNGNGTLDGSATIKVNGAEVANGPVPYPLIKRNPTYTDFAYSAPGDLTYSGSAKEATVTVTPAELAPYLGEVTVVYDGDNLVDSKPVNIGTYNVKVNVAGSDYYNAANGVTYDWSFTISAKDIFENDVTIDAIPNQTYTGSAIEPPLTVKYTVSENNVITLDKDRDYTVVYGENTNIGENAGSVTITGNGNYTGEKTVNFTIDYDTLTQAEAFGSAYDPNAWSNDPNGVTFDPVGDYTVSTTSDGNYRDSVSLSGNGSGTSADLYVKDGEGNIYKVTVQYNYDTTAPEVEVNINDPLDWSGESKTITVSTTELISGIKSVELYIGDVKQEDIPYTAGTFVVTEKKEYTVKVTDNAGNVTSKEVKDVGEILIDKTAPDISTVTIDPAVAGDWYTSNPTVTVTATDGESGLAAAAYSFDGSTNWQTSNTKTYTEDGTYTVTVWVKDAVGNIAKRNPETIKVDTTAPDAITVTATVGTDDYTSGTETHGDVVITLAGGEDATSGFDKYQYKIGAEGNWQDIVDSTYTHTASTVAGGVTYTFRAVDKAGNASVEVPFTVKKSFPVRFNANGGEGEMGNDTVYVNGAIVVPDCGFTREGYTFTGWNTAADGSGTEYLVGNEIRDIREAPGGGFDVYAQWEIITYNVTIDLNGIGAEGPADATYTVESDDITIANPTRTGYTFKGWSGTGLEGDANLTVTIPTGSVGDRTYTANWTVNEYTVKFDANGGTGDMADQSFTYDAAAQALTANAFTRDGYKFMGWAESAEANGVDYVNKQSVSNLTAELNGEVTLYAVWTRDIILSGDVIAPNVPNAEKLEVVLVGLDGTKYPVFVTGSQSPYHYTVTVPEGEYQLVIKDTQNNVTVTAKEELTEDKAEEPITMPTGSVNSIVDSTAAGDYTPIVGGLDDIAGNVANENAGFDVTVTLTVTHKPANEEDAEHDALMDAAGSQKSKLTFLEIDLEKNVDTVISSITETDDVIEIIVPFDTTRKQNFKVYRFHDGTVDVLTTTANTDGEYIEIGTGSVTIHAKKFSLYAIGYTDVIPVHGCTSKCPVCGGCKDADCTESACKDKCRLLGMNFTDVADSKWYTEPVAYVYHHKMMEGVGNNLFDINGTTTRAMIVTILWRLEGEPVVNYLMQFEDIPADTWYTEAVRWAASEKIVEGYSDTAFGPTNPITREQFATILWRYAKYKGYDVSVGEDTNILSYEDAFSISEYAIPAMQWACGAGLMQGDGVNLTPKADATRAQAAALFQRFCENVAEK